MLRFMPLTPHLYLVATIRDAPNMILRRFKRSTDHIYETNVSAGYRGKQFLGFKCFHPAQHQAYRTTPTYPIERTCTGWRGPT